MFVLIWRKIQLHERNGGSTLASGWLMRNLSNGSNCVIVRINFFLSHLSVVIDVSHILGISAIKFITPSGSIT